MRFKSTKNILMSAIQTVEGAVATKTTLPILSNVSPKCLLRLSFGSNLLIIFNIICKHTAKFIFGTWGSISLLFLKCF